MIIEDILLQFFNTGAGAFFNSLIIIFFLLSVFAIISKRFF